MHETDIKELKQQIDMIEYALKAANIKTMKIIKKTELRFIINIRSREEQFELIINYEDINNAPKLIRYSLIDEIPFWWCSAIIRNELYLDECKDLKEIFTTPGCTYKVGIHPLFFFFFLKLDMLHNHHQQQQQQNQNNQILMIMTLEMK